MTGTTGEALADEIMDILNTLKKRNKGMRKSKYNELMSRIEEYKSSKEQEPDSELESIEKCLYEMRNYSSAENSKMNRGRLVETDERHNELVAKLSAARQELWELENPNLSSTLGLFKYLFSICLFFGRSRKIAAKRKEIWRLEDSMKDTVTSIINQKGNKSKLRRMNTGGLAITPNAVNYILAT